MCLEWALISSGIANNGTKAGFVYGNSNNAASNTNSNIGSDVLITMIQKVSKDGMPFTTTIIEENEHFEFT